MPTIKSASLSLAIAALSSPAAFASVQGESAGVLEDAGFEILNRNYYVNADIRDNDASGQSYSEEWAHGVIGVFDSGFTQGPVGFGVDLIGLLGLKLDTGGGRVGAGLLELKDDGDARDAFAQFGAALKARISGTELKLGSQFIELPVFTTDAELLPEVAQGLMITSGEFDGLVLSGGHITALSSTDQTDHDSVGLEAANVLGGAYSFSENLAAALYYSDVEDAFDKYYGNLTYVRVFDNAQSLGLDFSLYQTEYERQYTGTGSREDNTIWSLSAAYSLDAHTFTLAYQHSSGGYIDEEGVPIGYDYGLDGDDTAWLANTAQYSDFIYKDERSWQIGYDVDLGAYGLPGLSVGSRYVYGDDIDLGAREAKEREFDIAVQYVVQTGAAKDLSLTVEQTLYRADRALDRDLDELSLIIEYPLEVL